MALDKNSKTALWLVAIAVALVYAGGGFTQLFSTMGITDGYISLAKSTVGISPATCVTTTGLNGYGRTNVNGVCDNGLWIWHKADYETGNLCYDETSNRGSADDDYIVRSEWPICAEFYRTIPGGRLSQSKDLKGLNYRADYSYSANTNSNGGANYRLYLTDAKDSLGLHNCLIRAFDTAPVRQTITESGLLEITPSVLTPAIVSIQMKGQTIATCDTTGWSGVYIFGTPSTNSQREYYSWGLATLRFTNPRYQPLLSCVKEPDELLAMESFAAGQELGIFSTRYAVQKFCLAHPVIVTSPTGSGTTAEPYQSWTQGRTLTVPQDQTWTVFYVMKNDGSLPTTCGEDAYDVKLGRCVTVSGLVQICSQGQFDPSLGLCVVQPESLALCPEGGRLDTNLNKCVYSPPIQMVCEQGVYDSAVGKCLFNPPSVPICSGTPTVNV